MPTITMINNREICLNDRINTSFEDGSMWQYYTLESGVSNTLKGIIIIPEEIKDSDFSIAGFIYGFIKGRGGVDRFPTLNKLSPWFGKQLKECASSNNDMWFVEEDEDVSEDILLVAAKDVKTHRLGDYVEFGNDEALMTLFGGIIQCVNWVE